MNRKISDNEFRESLDRRLSPLQPDPWMAQKIRNRARQKEGEPVKKRLSVGTVLVLVILLLSVSVGIATVSGWDVVQFLYGNRTVQPVPELEVIPVHREAVSDGAMMRIESAMYDGRQLAFDWHFENTKPETPVFGRLAEFTANGITVCDERSDYFDYLWMPSIFLESSSWDGGESVFLPEELRNAESLHVYVMVEVYRPVRPVYQMTEFDPVEAGRKIEEGYFVIAEEEGYVGWDPDEEQWALFYGTENPDGTSPDGIYEKETLEISFDVQRGSIGYKVLESLPAYESEHGTVSYDVAAVTSAGLQLTLRMVPENDAFSRMQDLVLTDGDGVPLEGDRFTPDVTCRVDTGEPGILVYRYRWSQTRLKDLPDAISLTCILEDGEKLVFPVKVR